MKILVTGGAGFIGSHLVRRLVKEGHEVVVLDNLARGNKLDKAVIEAVELVVGDVRDEALVTGASKGCDQIHHFAAVLGVDIVADNPVETMETEAAGMRNVANAALRHGVQKIVYASTSGVYGKSAIDKAVDEDYQASPSSSYAIAKRFNEIYLSAQYQEKRLNSVSIRFFNVYGPKQDQRMVIPRFIEKALAGAPLPIYGTGGQSRDFTYIDDVVESTVRCAFQVEGCEIINIARGQECTIKMLAEEIVSLTGSKSEIACINPPAGRYDFEVSRRIGDSKKLERLVGFVPGIDLREGLRRTIEDWRRHHTR
jgi:UDP-glucose 4-epimerase